MPANFDAAVKLDKNMAIQIWDVCILVSPEWAPEFIRTDCSGTHK